MSDKSINLGVTSDKQNAAGFPAATRANVPGLRSEETAAQEQEEARMQAQPHPLERFFRQAVRNSYEGRLGLHDPDVTGYIAQLLCEFTETDKLYSMRGPDGKPMEELMEMMRAADPVLGAAPSFDAERALRKHIGDYALFVAGMYPEAADFPRRRRRHQASLEELIHAGKESYYIVSQFDLFEYEQEAPLFARLSDQFENCIRGLTLVREELKPRKGLMPPRIN